MITHQPWMDEYERLWNKNPSKKEDIKRLITTQIAAAEERGKESVIKYIEEHKDELYGTGDNGQPEIYEYRLDDILEEARSNRPTV